MDQKSKPLIIAEACQNHNGDLKILRDMIYAAAEAGADCIKIQSIRSKELTHRPQFDEGVTEEGVVKVIKRPYKDEYDRLKKLDLTKQAHIWFINECKKAGIKPMTTVFTRAQVPFLSSLDWDSIKVASYDCGSWPLIRDLRENFKHLYISTGAMYDKEISATAKILEGHDYSFLHCVTIYPTPLNEVHLKRMDWLGQFTPSVGFSDHSLVKRDGLKASFAAIYYGANVIERHFTVLKPNESKDGPVSITPQHLKELAEFSKLSKNDQKGFIQEYVPEFEIMLGTQQRELSHAEKLNRDYYRGRFGTRKGDRVIYNWEEERLTSEV